MGDVYAVLATMTAFAAAWLYVVGCERLRRRDGAIAEERP